MNGPEDSDEKKRLELEELRLKIKELKRPFWLSSGVVTSMIITAITGLTGYFSGFFHVQLEKLQLETEKQELANQRVAIESRKLEEAKNALTSDLQKLKNHVSSLETREKALLGRNKQLQAQYNDALAPRLNAVVTDYFTANEERNNKFAITLQNSGKGPIKILPFDIFVDKKFVSTATTREPWIAALNAIDINQWWVRIWSAGDDPQLLQNLAPDEKLTVLDIFEHAVTQQRVRSLSKAADRLGILFCYCSAKHCAVLRFGELPDEVKTCRTSIKLDQIRW